MSCGGSAKHNLNADRISAAVAEHRGAVKVHEARAMFHDLVDQARDAETRAFRQQAGREPSAAEKQDITQMAHSVARNRMGTAVAELAEKRASMAEIREIRLPSDQWQRVDRATQRWDYGWVGWTDFNDAVYEAAKDEYDRLGATTDLSPQERLGRAVEAIDVDTLYDDLTRAELCKRYPPRPMSATIAKTVPFRESVSDLQKYLYFLPNTVSPDEDASELIVRSDERPDLGSHVHRVERVEHVPAGRDPQTGQPTPAKVRIHAQNQSTALRHTFEYPASHKVTRLMDCPM